MQLTSLTTLLFFSLSTITMALPQDSPGELDPIPSPSPTSEVDRCFYECYNERMPDCPDPAIYIHEHCMCKNGVTFDCNYECDRVGSRPEMCRPNTSTMTPDPTPTEGV
ncbi:hypothetical protein EX30DRAFT_366546 [Ascodesmis nigricans]|uniref:Extracellular membrane protein CFEM domain-containing protein n=1 Tax=Ascodesmis nigricans TaxID=341454 RepID=A0A4S2MRM4_9PEZI|nr:hypothetical protein EX30DRAFT_366546 [Ascodesmis nigricans]